MGINEDVKDVEKTLENHGERISRLEIDSEVMKERFNNFSTQLTRVENTVLTSNNTILQTLSTVVNNTTSNQTQVVTTTSNNRKDVIIKILTILGAVLAGWLASKFGIQVNM